MRTALDIAYETVRNPNAKERRAAARDMLELIRLWIYWENGFEEPRESLLRSLRQAESVLERAA